MKRQAVIVGLEALVALALAFAIVVTWHAIADGKSFAGFRRVFACEGRSVGTVELTPRAVPRSELGEGRT